MTTPTRIPAMLLALAIAVAACGGGGSTGDEPLPTEGAGATTEPGATMPAMSLPAIPTVDPGDGTSMAPDLEAYIPDEVGGIALAKSSIDYTQLGMVGIFDPGTLDPILEGTGKTIADVRFAFGTPADPSSVGTRTVYVWVIEIAGLSGEELLPVFSGDRATPLVSLGGKQVRAEGEGGNGALWYVKGDVLVHAGWFGMDAGAGEELASKLP